jgi:hypothetical protein
MTAKAAELGAVPTLDISSTHYYAHLDSNETIKMIDYPDRVEIHRVGYNDGLYSIDEVTEVTDVEAGFEWFKKEGFKELDVLEMRDQEFSYLGGGFALYTVDKDILSVILGYEEEKLPEMEKVFGLEGAEQIVVPYNVYVGQLGRLHAISLD